jgi:uncharacterized membrane protein YdjX (TVP38/TMEM64 family)
MIARNRRFRRLPRSWRRVAVFCVLVGALTIPADLSPVAAAPAQAQPDYASNPIYTWLQEHRAAAYWVAPLLMVVVAILPIPAEIPAAMNGMLFGAGLGTVITWVGAMVGAMISYELARCFGRELTRRFVSSATMEKLDRLQHTEAAVLLTLRLMPVVAFTAINWTSGLLQVRRSTFVWTTAVGILPGAVAFTASGSVLAALYERYPGTITAVAMTLCAAILMRAWWKQRSAPTP